MQATVVARTGRESLLLTDDLSANHLLGFTLVTGAALAANLRLLGVLLSGQSVIDGASGWSSPVDRRRAGRLRVYLARIDDVAFRSRRVAEDDHHRNLDS